MCWWMSLRGFWLWFRPGRGYIGCRGGYSDDLKGFLRNLKLFFDRDIPLPLVTSGCENSGNLRELALNRMKDFGAVCRDVRFREVGVSSMVYRPLDLLTFDITDSRNTS
jgi:hypothetical protein